MQHISSYAIRNMEQITAGLGNKYLLKGQVNFSIHIPTHLKTEVLVYVYHLEKALQQ